MRSGRSMKAGVLAATVGVALLLAAAAAMAQAPERDRRSGPGGTEAARPRGEAPLPQRGGPQEGLFAGGGWGLGLLAAPDVDVEVTQNKDGVTLLVTSDKPDLAERIRERLPQAIERMREMRSRRGYGPVGAARFNAFVNEKVDVEFVKKRKGVVIILTSDDRKIAAQIKETVPQRIKMMKQFRERGQGERPGAPGRPPMGGRPGAGDQPRMGGRPGAGDQPWMGAMGGWLRLLASEGVKIKRRERKDGVVLTYTSDDKEVAEFLRKLSAQQLEHIEQMRRHRGESQMRPPRGSSGSSGQGGEQGPPGERGGEQERRGGRGGERDDDDEDDDD